MIRLSKHIPSITLALCVIAAPHSALAQDLRSMAMGGTGVSSGQGVGGFLSNPALLMRAQRLDQKYHFHFSAGGHYRDSIDTIQLYDDNQDLIDDFNTEIDLISAQTLSCIPDNLDIPAPADLPDTVCLNNTQGLGALAAQSVDIFNQVDDETLDGHGGTTLGFAATGMTIPISASYSARVTALGTADISDADFAYAQALDTALSDNSLTVAEITDVASIDVVGDTVENLSITVDVPEDVLTSTIQTHTLLRSQFSLSFARQFNIAEQEVDIGITPKVSNLTAASVVTVLSAFDDDTYDYEDELERSEVSETIFGLDLGASTLLLDDQLLTGLVIRNLVPQSITTNATPESPAYKFESTPQLIASASYQREQLLLTSDLALNSAKQDNFETQRLKFGTEYDFGVIALRGGLQHDLAVSRSATLLTLGLGAGFFDFALAMEGSDLRSGGLQVAFNF